MQDVAIISHADFKEKFASIVGCGDAMCWHDCGDDFGCDF